MEGNPLENPRIQSDFCRIFYREFNFFRDKEVVSLTHRSTPTAAPALLGVPAARLAGA